MAEDQYIQVTLCQLPWWQPSLDYQNPRVKSHFALKLSGEPSVLEFRNFSLLVDNLSLDKHSNGD